MSFAWSHWRYEPRRAWIPSYRVAAVISAAEVRALGRTRRLVMWLGFAAGAIMLLADLWRL